MAMTITASANHTLDALLELVCFRIQLTDTQDSKARGHYAAVSDWLARDGSPLQRLNPHIYPQGSQRLGTTTKPIGQTEFDLDAICRLDIQEECHPGVVYRLLWERLWENRIYRPMMKRMPRCVRLEYAGDFHLDIAPAVPDLVWGGNCILVPDLDANLAVEHPENDQWKSTNPRDFAQWFDKRCVERIVLNEKYARAQVDPVPDHEPVYAKAALKRSVQLFKRWRDKEYQERPKLSPPSIILTTLAGHYYLGQSFCTDALGRILESIVQRIESEETIRMTNPAHPVENICEKWNKTPGSYRDFTNSVTAFRERWERLLYTRGLHDIEEELADLFGEAPVQWAVRELAERQVIRPRADRSLGVQRSTGVLAASASALPVRSNTFVGDHQSVRK